MDLFQRTKWFLGITKSWHHPRSSTTICDYPRPAIILQPPLTTTDDQPLFCRHHPQPAIISPPLLITYRVFTEFFVNDFPDFCIKYSVFFPDLSLGNCIYFPWLILKNIVFSLTFWVDLPVQIQHLPILWQRTISNDNDLINTIVVTYLIIFWKNFLIQFKAKIKPKQNKTILTMTGADLEVSQGSQT